jgi:aryl carrier-like protein
MLPADVDTWPLLPPIGKPLPHVEVWILGDDGAPVPDGAVGELNLGGPCLALGYLAQPERTRERFRSNPIGEGRLYRTGDLGRRNRAGELEFVGRADRQVKVRGYRVELGEIEAVLAQHPDVHEATVIASDDVTGNRRLVAYVVPSGQRVDAHSPLTRQFEPRWFDFLRRRLPEYMVPTTFVTVAAIARTPNGKLDRARLPLPSTRRPSLAPALIPPRTALERQLAALWCQALQLTEVGIHDNFFDLGGNSLMLVYLQGRLHEQLQRELPVVRLVENPTIEQLARHLESAFTPAPEPEMPRCDRTSAGRMLRRRQRSAAQAVHGENADD